MSAKANFLDRVLNVNNGEWPRISLSWVLNFLYRSSFVIGWTIVVGMFVGRFGISSLPLLFIANGVFMIIGSIIYSSLLDKLSKERIIMISVIGAMSFMIAAVILEDYSKYLYFGLLLASLSVFLAQLKIHISGFVETLFTPLESERTFPIIESAETVGGIVAGILVVTFSGSLDPNTFIFVILGLTTLYVPTLLMYRKSLKKVHRVALEDGHEHVGLTEKFREVFSQARHVAFIKGLMVVVILQWIFANMIEFQYTKAVTQNVSEAILNSGSGFEHALVHDLGALFIVFSVSAMLIQLFIGSRLMTSLGIMGSMMIHPIVMLLSIFGLTVRFGYPTAVLAQTNQSMTHVLYLNAYHSAYYSVREHFREYVREFLEGFVRPLGAIIGTSMLLGLQKLFTGSDLTLSINLVMIVVLLLLTFIVYGLQSSYTKLALHNLRRSDDKIDRVEAIQILSQRGHKSSIPELRKILHDPMESDFIKEKILEAFGELQDVSTLDDIILFFNSKKVDLRKASVEALIRFDSVHSLFSKNIFYEYKLVTALKLLYLNEKNDEIRSQVIFLLSKMNPVGTFGFLLDILKKSKCELRADVILALGSFKSREVIEYIKPYLTSKKSYEKSAAMIALWHFHEYRDDIEHQLSEMLKERKNIWIKSALFVVGELNLKRYKHKCSVHLHAKDSRVRMHAALALAKMGSQNSVEVLVDILFTADASESSEIRRSLSKLRHKTRKSIENSVRLVVSKKIDELLCKTHAKSLKHLEAKDLKYLKMLYSLVDEHEEVELISELLYSKSYS